MCSAFEKEHHFNKLNIKFSIAITSKFFFIRRRDTTGPKSVSKEKENQQECRMQMSSLTAL